MQAESWSHWSRLQVQMGYMSCLSLAVLLTRVTTTHPLKAASNLKFGEKGQRSKKGLPFRSEASPAGLGQELRQYHYIQILAVL